MGTLSMGDMITGESAKGPALQVEKPGVSAPGWVRAAHTQASPLSAHCPIPLRVSAGYSWTSTMSKLRTTKSVGQGELLTSERIHAVWLQEQLLVCIQHPYCDTPRLSHLCGMLDLVEEKRLRPSSKTVPSLLLDGNEQNSQVPCRCCVKLVLLASIVLLLISNNLNMMHLGSFLIAKGICWKQKMIFLWQRNACGKYLSVCL